MGCRHRLDAILSSRQVVSPRWTVVLGAVAIMVVLVLGACGDGDRGRGDTAEPQQAPDGPPGATGPAGSTDLRGVSVLGVLTDPRGVPVPGAMIDPIAVDGQVIPAKESFNRTDDNGTFHLALPAGRWDLSIAANGFEPRSERIDVPSSGVLRIVLALRPES